jgi:hypothetical protein
MKHQTAKLFVPVLGLFVFFSSLFSLGKSWLAENGFSYNVLMAGNLILFLVSCASLYFHIKGFLNKNVNAFLRSIYSSLLVKMFVCVAAVVIYAVLAKEELNKPGLFLAMALYFVYTFVEVRMVFRLLKQTKKNG